LRHHRSAGIFRPPAGMSAAAVEVVLFTDFASPFAWVTEAALARMEEAGEARVTPVVWELYPAPAPLPAPETAPDALLPLASELGLAFGPPPVPARTRKAHEAAAFAAARGSGPAYRAAVFAARYAEGRDIGRVDVLVEIGARLGLDAGELKVVLDIDTLAEAVAAQDRAARRAGVEGVPTLVVGTGEGARWTVGARPLGALRAWVQGRERSG
jgi:predicted DsbA family dithiol-disulfide isomerase